MTIATTILYYRDSACLRVLSRHHRHPTTSTLFNNTTSRRHPTHAPRSKPPNNNTLTIPRLCQFCWIRRHIPRAPPPTSSLTAFNFNYDPIYITLATRLSNSKNPRAVTVSGSSCKHMLLDPFLPTMFGPQLHADTRTRLSLLFGATDIATYHGIYNPTKVEQLFDFQSITTGTNGIVSLLQSYLNDRPYYETTDYSISLGSTILGRTV